jgi:tetratricopeptide (TPR) repeat protein
MAFGFGFNKQKILSVAEKFVQQGKLQNAIAEYEKIIKSDAKDLTVANTVGDLYARLGENDKAIECFKSVGDAYATQGFTVKAIAMYKKISKIKTTLEGILKLAELYTQQGLFNDARAQYLQVAEEFLRAGELEQAVRIFQKILEMDPENVAMRVRLAEVYIRLGKKTEAWQIFSTAADSLRKRGQLGPAEEILQRMMSLDPGNGYALLLRGRNALENGEIPGAIKYLEKVADLDSHPDGLRDLLKAYVQSGRMTDAVVLAGKLLTVHNDMDGVSSVAEGLMHSGHYQDALQLYCEHSERLLSTNPAKVLKNLHSIIGHVRDHAEALETLLKLFHKAGENTHVSEVTELLAHAYVQSGNLAGARDLYQKLAAMEPQNALHMRNYQQVVAMTGGTNGSRMITAEEGAVMVDELEATAPVIEQHYPDNVAIAVRSALTDADLFVSYNMPAKALVPLMAVLSQAPRDVRLNQRLAALHTRGERFAEAAVCCRNLEAVFSETDHPDEAVRYGELASKYEERAAASHVNAASEKVATTTWAETSTPVELAHTGVATATEFQVQDAAVEPASEIDLSEEWEGALSGEPASVPARDHGAEVVPAAVSQEADNSQAVAETIEEIRFYLGHFMGEQARGAMAKLEALTSDSATLATMRAEIEAAGAASEISEPEIVEEVAPELAQPEQRNADLKELTAELEASLGEGFDSENVSQSTISELTARPETARVEYAQTEHAVAAQQKSGVLGELVSDLESSLGDGFMKEAPVVEPEPATRFDKEPEPELEPESVSAKAPVFLGANSAAPEPAPAVPQMAAAAAAPSVSGSPSFTYRPTKIRPLADAAVPAKFSANPGVDLAEMFGELKHELEEDVATAEEDPETHYNLGVAFREMGLLDEAIGELQKVCQAVEHGHPFPHIMQTYTWLSQCFLDKGVPEAAIRWYEQALKLTDIDQETRMALHYELASAYETANNKPAALSHFMEVYGTNIDYRDVSERIKALKS